MEEEASQLLEQLIIYYQGRPVGTVAAGDAVGDEEDIAEDIDRQPINYDQCFIRDFVSAAFVFLIKGQTEIVRNFLEETLRLQSQGNEGQPGLGAIPCSFKIEKKNGEETAIADYGNLAIGRVTPVDASLWWLIILRAYMVQTGDRSLAHQPNFQDGIRLILNLCLAPRFDDYPTLLVADGSCMIDRRMSMAGHPLEIQSLFYAALRSSQELLLENEENESLLVEVNRRLIKLEERIRDHYWLDSKRLEKIYHYPQEEYGESADNPFNLYPDCVDFDWLETWLPENGGYFVGNMGTSLLDSRFFTVGNLMAIIAGLSTEGQSEAIMELIQQRWDDLVGRMPMKICYSPLKSESENSDWKLVTGCDPKNRPWSYHNGGNWPVLLWMLAAAALKTRRRTLVEKAIAIAEQRLSTDNWPEYYDGKHNRFVGQKARQFQAWTISGYLLAQQLMTNPESLEILSFE